MILKKIILPSQQAKQLPFLSDVEAKFFFQNQNILKQGWSFSNIYHFTEIRDIYLTLKKTPIKQYTYKQYEAICLRTPYVDKPWNARRIEEYINALKNFQVLDNEGNIINPLKFQSKENEPLTPHDFEIFKRIYFTYFRFKEVMGWFINPLERYSSKKITNTLITKKSKIVFSFSSKSRFTDTIFYKLDCQESFMIKSIEGNSAEAMKRFWDVFCKWGTELNLIQKFNLDYFNIKTEYSKSIACTYFIDSAPLNIDLKEFIKHNFKNNYIHIPELVLKIALHTRSSINSIKSFILSEYEKDKYSYSLDRTSEIFIKKSEIKSNTVIFHPLYKNTYISHLILT